MQPRRQSMDVQVTQGALNYARKSDSPPTRPFIATVTAVYPDRMTCDLLSIDGGPLTNVPVLTRAGLIDGAPYGEFWMPVVDDKVLVFHAGNGEQLLVIVGTIIPYLVNEYNADAVNSSSKQFTKKLLEEGTEKHDKKIFKNGVSVETLEDGTLVVEAPSGTYIRIDETTGEVKVQDQHGNNITMGTSSVTVNGNLEVLQ